jgi:hypothetical protein
MINDLDEVLRQLLIRELPIRNGEVDVTFDQPKREWSARLSRPTLNVYLYDVRENQKLRQTQPLWEMTPNEDGTVTQHRKPVRMDLHYIITAWATEPEDEHQLLTRTLMALFRYAHLPGDLLPASLQSQSKPIPMMVAQYDEYRNPTDVWQVLDNEIRPAIACILTLALDPYEPVVAPLVRTRELRFGQAVPPTSQQELDERAGQDVYWTIGGTVQSKEPLEEMHLVLLEQGREVSLQPDGRFAIGHLRAGEYTLEVSKDGRGVRQFKIDVPSADLQLEV